MDIVLVLGLDLEMRTRSQSSHQGRSKPVARKSSNKDTKVKAKRTRRKIATKQPTNLVIAKKSISKGSANPKPKSFQVQSKKKAPKFRLPTTLDEHPKTRGTKQKKKLNLVIPNSPSSGPEVQAKRKSTPKSTPKSKESSSNTNLNESENTEEHRSQEVAFIKSIQGKKGNPVCDTIDPGPYISGYLKEYEKEVMEKHMIWPHHLTDALEIKNCTDSMQICHVERTRNPKQSSQRRLRINWSQEETE